MPRWTPEARERQRQLIQSWKPWEHSTGATSDYGKQVSSQNNPYCSEGWRRLKAIQPILKQLDRYMKTGEVSDEVLSQFPMAIEVLKKVMRSPDLH